MVVGKNVSDSQGEFSPDRDLFLLLLCHPERVTELLYLIVFIADNVESFGCVGTVQANCANFSQFCCCNPFGHEELARPSFEFVRAEVFRPFAGHLNGEHRLLPHRIRAFAGLVQNECHVET
jgi:hypothetical protein